MEMAPSFGFCPYDWTRWTYMSSFKLVLRAQLQVVYSAVEAVLCQQLVVRSTLDNLAVFQDEDQVGPANG